MPRRGNTGRLLAFAVIAVVAVVLGLLIGRACSRTSESNDAGNADAGDVGAGDADAGDLDAGVAEAVGDAGAADAGGLVEAVVDAGAAIALVAPVGPTHHGRRARAEEPVDNKPVDNKPVESTAVAKEPVVVDAGEAEAVHDAGVAAAAHGVVDAGVADAGTARAAHQDLAPEPLPSAPLTVRYTDEVSAWLKLIQVRVFVDGKRVTDANDQTGIDARKARVFYEGTVFPGTHQVRVETLYVGKANGLFSYMEGIHIKVRGMTLVHPAEGKPAHVDAVAYDKGALQQFENRAGLRITVR